MTVQWTMETGREGVECIIMGKYSLHGMCPLQIAVVADMTKSYQWLERAGLKNRTEILVTVVQQLVLSTRAIEAQIYHSRKYPRCSYAKRLQKQSSLS